MRENKTKKIFSDTSQERKNIAIIIPITFKNRFYNKTFLRHPFFKVELPSFLETCSGHHIYNFYLGYDNDDVNFIKWKEEFKKKFIEKCGENFSINMIEMKNLTGKLGEIWSSLAEAARTSNDYLFQIGDDIKFFTKNWDMYFIDRLQKTNNIGVVGPLDRNINNCLLTQSFVHVTHLDIFGTYYPKEIINWDIDLWITYIYGAVADPNIQIKNTSGHKERYKPINNKQNYIKIRNRDLKKLSEYIKEKSKAIIRNIDEEQPAGEITLSVGIPTLTNRKIPLLRLLNKIRWCSFGIQEKLEIIVHEDNRQKSIGVKRNEIINSAKGEYFCFIDDDDLVSDDYFRLIFEHLKEKPDGVGFKGIYYEKEFIKRLFIHSGSLKKHIETKITRRPLNHLNPVKLSIIKKIPYQDRNNGEDRKFTDELVNKRLIKNSSFIDEFLYHYLYNPQK